MSSTLAICFAFLLGSFPSGIVMGRILTGEDIRKRGSGNFGAANVARTAGFGAGITVAIADILKGVLAVGLGMAIGLSPNGLALVAFAAVLGHDFSIFLRFKGGKGVATTLGVSILLFPIAALAGAVVWVITVVISRYTSLASLVSLGLLPIFVAVAGGRKIYVGLAIALLLLAAAKHWENIIRLIGGRESKFGR